MKNVNLFTSTFFILCIMTNGCTPVRGETTTETPLLDSKTPIPKATTPLQSLTPTQTKEPEITLVPVLPAEEAEAKVIELLQTNGGCQLPCFWGLTPGQTQGGVAISYLHQFPRVPPEIEITIPREDYRIGINILFNGSLENKTETLTLIEVITRVYYRNFIEGGHVDINNFDNPYYHEYFQYYTLPYLLKNYGKPDDIYFDIETDFVKEFHIYLDYSQLGWGAKLTMPLSITKDVVKGCPAKAFTSLWLWTPGDTNTANKFGFGSNSLFKSIQEIPDITLEEFYNNYKDPTNGECLEIPLSVWP